MKPSTEKDPRFGSINRDCREGERIVLSSDGVKIGHIDVVHVPHDGKIRLCLYMAKDIRVTREAKQ